MLSIEAKECRFSSRDRNILWEYMSMGKPHVLAIPYPAQGHVIPLMELVQYLANNGIRVTFVNTDFNHERIVKSMSHDGSMHELIHLASIPDGLEQGEDRNELGRLTAAMLEIMPATLEALVQEINNRDEDKVVCIIADYGLGWAMEVAKRLGIKKAAFLPASVALLALTLNASKLIEDGVIDCDGTPHKQQIIQLSPDMPKMNTHDLVWTRLGAPSAQKILFNIMQENLEQAKLAEWILCNSFQELEPGAFTMLPNCTPLGPLLASNRLGSSTGFFWPEESCCLAWLDQQPPNSTIYVAFGSFTIFSEIQFQELALGLELTNRPFLWVVRQDADKAYPEGFLERVKNQGKIVAWAPQQKVLSHRSVSCFLSHCGWNSTVEGVSNGVPFLCWPYFADQFMNQTYISDCWRVGLRLDEDDNGIIRRDEIRVKVDVLLSDDGYRVRVLDLKKTAVSGIAEGGISQKNLDSFIAWIKDN